MTKLIQSLGKHMLIPWSCSSIYCVNRTKSRHALSSDPTVSWILIKGFIDLCTWIAKIFPLTMSGTLLHLPSFLPLSVGSLVEWWAHQASFRWKFPSAWEVACFTDCGFQLLLLKRTFSEYLMEVRFADNNHCTGICGVHVPQMLPTPSATAVRNPASAVGVLVST